MWKKKNIYELKNCEKTKLWEEEENCDGEKNLWRQNMCNETSNDKREKKIVTNKFVKTNKIVVTVVIVTIVIVTVLLMTVVIVTVVIETAVIVTLVIVTLVTVIIVTVAVVTVAVVTAVVVTYFSKNNLTHQQLMRCSQGIFLK